MYVYLKYTKHGYEISVVGESERTARYVGIKVERVIMRTMIISGALCGIAGLLLVAGNGPHDNHHALGLARLHRRHGQLACQVQPHIHGAHQLPHRVPQPRASEIATDFGLNEAFGDMLTGVILFFIIGCEFFITYRLHFRSAARRQRRRRKMFDFLAFIPRAVSQSVPLMLGSTGETLTQKSGNLNLGLPGVMYVGAICGVIGAFFYEQSTPAEEMNAPPRGRHTHDLLPCGQPAHGPALLLPHRHAARQPERHRPRHDHLGVGFGKFFGGSLIKLTDSEIPSLALTATSSFFKARLPFAGSLGAVGEIVLSYGFPRLPGRRHLHRGLLLPQAHAPGPQPARRGRGPATADAAGINVTGYKYKATCIGCMIAAVGGLYYVMDYSSGIWANDAFGDRGWLAIALVIFTMWRPAVSIPASILFGGLYILYIFIPTGTNLAVRSCTRCCPTSSP